MSGGKGKEGDVCHCLKIAQGINLFFHLSETSEAETGSFIGQESWSQEVTALL